MGTAGPSGSSCWLKDRVSLLFGSIWCDVIALPFLSCTFVIPNAKANDTRILSPLLDEVLLKTIWRFVKRPLHRARGNPMVIYRLVAAGGELVWIVWAPEVEPSCWWEPEKTRANFKPIRERRISR